MSKTPTPSKRALMVWGCISLLFLAVVSNAQSVSPPVNTPPTQTTQP